MKVKIIQWNIWTQENPQNIVDFIKESKADIVCTQENIRNSKTGINTAEYIAKNLNFNYYNKDADTWDNNIKREAQGNAIFSRFPISHQTFKYVQEPKHNPPNAWSEGRVYLELTLEVNSKELVIGNTHLSYSNKFEITKQRKVEVNNLVDILKRHKRNYIFTADLNSAPKSYTLLEIEKYLKHAGPSFDFKSWPTKPFNYNGFIANKLDWRIDYVFATQDIKILEASILDSKYSDHLPLEVIVDC